MSLDHETPRILYVTPLWPPCGARQRCLQVLDALQQIGKVELAILDKGSTDRSLIELANASVRTEYAGQQVARSSEGWIRKFVRKIDARSNYPDGWKVKDGSASHLIEHVNDFDLVWIFQLYSAEFFENRAWPRSVLDIDDVPSVYESSGVKTERGAVNRASAVFRSWAWKRREKLLSDRFTLLTVCSSEDREYLEKQGHRAPIHVIPNGFKAPLLEPVRKVATPPRVGFIGHFSHFPNPDGLRWFFENCWPLIRREVPDARLRIVGPGSDGPLAPSGPDVDNLGWLANPSEEISTWALMIVPIRIGGGTRVKIAEAFSEKCPIVSTSFGAHGYAARHGEFMYVGDSSENFARACVHAIVQPEGAAQMAQRAWDEFLKKWSWDAIRPQVWAAAEDCLRRQ